MAVPIGIDDLLATQVSPPRLTRIYVLKDPRDGAVRYVGKTVAQVRIRLSNHITAAIRDGKDTYVCRWIRKLHADGVQPTVEMIDTAGDDWAKREAYWIDWYWTRGAKLTNVTLGGEGTLGFRHTAEMRALIGVAASASAQSRSAAGLKRAPLSAEYRAKIALNSAGRTHTPESRALIGAAHRGMKHTDEARAKMSAALTGRTLSPEHKAAVGAAHLGKVNSPETRARMSLAQTGRVHSTETRARISAIRTGTTASDETKERIRTAVTGRKHTEETKQRLRESHTGRVHSPGAIARMVEVKRNISPETRARMSVGQQRRFAKQTE